MKNITRLLVFSLLLLCTSAFAHNWAEDPIPVKDNIEFVADYDIVHVTPVDISVVAEGFPRVRNYFISATATHAEFLNSCIVEYDTGIGILSKRNKFINLLHKVDVSQSNPPPQEIRREKGQGWYWVRYGNGPWILVWLG